jgi:hypothetical protein
MSNIATQPGVASGPSMPANNDVPNPTILLAIQVAGGFLSLLPIWKLNQFAELSDPLYRLLLFSAVANAIISAAILICFLTRFRFLLFVIERIGELGICRGLIFYDMIMLGLLVYLTGGSEKSAFAPQFAAVLPVAMLISDQAAVKWAYAGVFLFMFLLGLQPNSEFVAYLENSDVRKNWFLIFFFIFTLFPVIYSIQSERGGSDATGAANLKNVSNAGLGERANTGLVTDESLRKALEDVPPSSEVETG